MTGFDPDTAVAVVGAGSRFPDAWTPDEFWGNLDAGLVSLREIADDDLRRAGVDAATLGRPDYVRVAATLPGTEEFAADFFGYRPAEAELVDPQQRVFLECCWQALDAAGHHPDADETRVGVFGGVGPSGYAMALYLDRARRAGVAAFDDVELHLGSAPDYLTSRVAYKLGLRGPAVTVQTACSSSLVAVHYAATSLIAEECDLALAGGASIPVPAVGYAYQPGGLMSEDGYCRSFDIDSSGTANGAGVAVVALRRLADALADGDTILAVLTGSAVNNDGANRPGFTAPSPDGIRDVVTAALGVSGTGPDELCYVEAHGSGTPLGDRVELRGLVGALRGGTARRGYCGLGSVKGNIGHAGAAAGIAGLMKAIHVARTGHLPPQPFFERARDPGVLADSPFRVPTELDRCPDPGRRVLVDSMGLGGANAAVVVAPPPEPVRPAAVATGTVRVVVSAGTRVELDRHCRDLADALDAGAAPVGDLAHTLRVGRRAFAERRVVEAPPDGLAAALRLPRPPAARTVRATGRRVAIRAPERLPAPLAAVVEALRAALPGAAALTPDQPAPAGSFVLSVTAPGAAPTGRAGAGAAAGDHVLALHPEAGGVAEAVADRLDEALCAAWLNGARVDWAAVDGGRGRRVPLPAHPLRRRRCWALDDAGRSALAPAPEAPAAAPAAPATGDDLERDLLTLWRELFGHADIGPDDEFGRLGGTSLLGVRMVLEVQRRHGRLLDLHRVGGSRATVRALAAAVRGGRAADAGTDEALIDADLDLPLGPVGPAVSLTVPPTGRPDVLLTGATGFVGAFLLAELLRATPGRVVCPVRAADAAEGLRRLADAARHLLLPAPPPDRVVVVPTGLADLGAALDRGPGATVGRVVHAAARVLFTEPYRELRADNVVGFAALLRWMRSSGVTELSLVSSMAACAPAGVAEPVVAEQRRQPLDPRAGGYGTSKWVAERLLDRAEREGMQVRVFRPGLVLGSTATGACNPKDMIWRILAAGLAVGAHPLDDRPLAAAPVDAVARGVVALSALPGSQARAYHLVDRVQPGPRELFAMLAEAGMPTEGLPPDAWQRRVAERALATGDPVLTSVGIYDPTPDASDWARVECDGWQGWLRDGGTSAAATPELLARCVGYLATRQPFEAVLAARRGEGAAQTVEEA